MDNDERAQAIVEKQDDTLRDCLMDNGNGLELEVVVNLSDEELEDAYGAAWRRWRADTNASVDRLKELAPEMPWQDKMAVSMGFSAVNLSSTLLAQLGLVQTIRNHHEGKVTG